MREICTQILSSYLLAVGLTVACGIAICLVPAPAWASDQNAPIVIRGSSTLQPVVEKWAGT